MQYFTISYQTSVNLLQTNVSIETFFCKSFFLVLRGVCHCIVRAAALLGYEGSGRHEPVGALPGQEGSGDGID